MYSGPCLKHCYDRKSIARALAYVTLWHALSAAGYLALTQSVGTPLKDSLTEAQRAIKKRSATVRRQKFVTAGVLSALLLALAQPL